MKLEEIRQIVKNNPETRDLELSDTDLITVYQYLENKNNLKNGYKEVLKTKPHIHIVLVPTKEKKEAQIKDYLNRQQEIFEGDVFIQDAYLDEFRTDTPNKEKALEHVKKFISEYPKVDKGLYLYGPYGTGKSYLLSAMAKELTKNNLNVLFIFMPDLVRSIKNDMQNGILEKRINQLKQCDCLILDDLGGENVSDWFRDEILFPILHYRLSAHLPVFITTNLTPKQLVDTLAQTKNPDAKVKSARLIRRVVDLTIACDFGNV
ncbi:DNA replication protein DnaC [Alteracholeplasma palmae J233]|uniref:DNA replication protein DnaC n=1 Tax=Alteracholeplasma palmae (strain ATCC 49389 / J233) TaxID=1318466 RepID=U4KPB1_ALTPJ|nr:AFG1/ZapE family ATPase [Alteracholeplasma palmae]CCV64060.1 DNA replication protein DnaC [Alteracholeplasma palmae J233]